MLAPVRKTAPVEMPVTLVEARRHLDVYGFTDDDDQIRAFVNGATNSLETELDMALVTQVWEQSFGGFNCSLRLRLRPVTKVLSVTYYDAENVKQTLPSSEYGFLTYAIGTVLQTAPAHSWPATYNRPDAVTIEYEAGVPAAEVDAALKIAILMHVGSLYNHRDDLSAVKIQSSGAYEMLIFPYRRPKV